MTLARTSMRGRGWLPDWPDIRDFTAEHAVIAPPLGRSHLRAWCPPSGDQGRIGSCTNNRGDKGEFGR